MAITTPISNLLCAWLVHVLTASGAIFGLLAMQATAEHAYTTALLWMTVTVAIDGVDGALARTFRVKFYLPHLDGALLDNMVDYFTYVIVPAYFLLHAELLSVPWRLPIAITVVLTSAYQFSRTDAKTQDHTFTGFPSYWNVVVFYLYLLEWSRPINAVILIACALGVFVPIHYLYPSRTPMLRPINIALGLLWSAMLIVALLRYPTGHEILTKASLFYVAYYLAVSLYLTAHQGIKERVKKHL